MAKASKYTGVEISHDQSTYGTFQNGVNGSGGNSTLAHGLL